MYFIGFANYKEMVVQVYPVLDLSAILALGEEEGEAEANHKTIRANRAVVKASLLKTTIARDSEESVATLKV